MKNYQLSNEMKRIKHIINHSDFTSVNDIWALIPGSMREEFQRLVENLTKNGYSRSEAELCIIRDLISPQKSDNEKSEEVDRSGKQELEPTDKPTKPEDSKEQISSGIGTNERPSESSISAEKHQGSEPASDSSSKKSNGSPVPDSKLRRRGRKGKIGRRATPPGGRKTGVGNRTKQKYPNAKKLNACIEGEAEAGNRCPICKSGSLYAMKPLECLRFEAGQIIQPIIFQVHRNRCNSCEQVYAAELPTSFGRDIAISKATPDAAALSILLKFGLGFPDLRLDRLQEWQGAPFDNSRQGRITSESFERLVHVRNAFNHAVSNATIRSVDDCSVRIISEMLEIREEQFRAEQAGYAITDVRSGINITTYIAEYQGRSYTAFLAGRQHQGEREYEMQQNRTSSEALVRVSDAASKADSCEPFPDQNEHGFRPRKSGNSKGSSSEKGIPEAEVAACLQHLRETFIKAQPGHKKEVEYVLGLLSQIFEKDAETKEMTETERLAYLQEKASPIMNDVKIFVNAELEHNIQAEPNGDYRKALNYCEKHWQKLTLFLRKPSIPLTTNHVESANRFAKQQCRPSLAFQTSKGAMEGAFFMSLIATCLAIDKNPLHYLANILRYWKHISSENAFDWMPHVYESAIELAVKKEEEDASTLGYELRHRTKKELPELDIYKVQMPSLKENNNIQPRMHH